MTSNACKISCDDDYQYFLWDISPCVFSNIHMHNTSLEYKVDSTKIKKKCHGLKYAIHNELLITDLTSPLTSL